MARKWVDLHVNKSAKTLFITVADILANPELLEEFEIIDLDAYFDDEDEQQQFGDAFYLNEVEKNKKERKV